MTLKYVKVRKVKSPSRAHPFDAGIDFFVPESITKQELLEKINVVGDNLKVQLDEARKYVTKILLEPGQSVLLPSGIHVNVPEKYALIFMNKSGVASKKHLHVGAAVVDAGYQGECHINLTNVGNTPQEIDAGDKIVQGILMPVECCDVLELKSRTELYPDESERSDGGFGSSGTK